MMTIPWPRPNAQKGCLKAAGLDEVGKGHNGQGGAGAETGDGESRGEAPLVREPFHGVAGGGGEDRRSADAGDDRGDIEKRQ